MSKPLREILNEALFPTPPSVTRRDPKKNHLRAPEHERSDIPYNPSKMTPGNPKPVPAGERNSFHSEHEPVTIHRASNTRTVNKKGVIVVKHQPEKAIRNIDKNKSKSFEYNNAARHFSHQAPHLGCSDHPDQHGHPERSVQKVTDHEEAERIGYTHFCKNCSNKWKSDGGGGFENAPGTKTPIHKFKAVGGAGKVQNPYTRNPLGTW